ncbi:MAG: hypothetical protein K0S11_1470, partial [Gammaproteobacteria bacterium]|nr:hypothetical protein [Gammaproteobacteria bacterium]
ISYSIEQIDDTYRATNAFLKYLNLFENSEDLGVTVIFASELNSSYLTKLLNVVNKMKVSAEKNSQLTEAYKYQDVLEYLRLIIQQMNDKTSCAWLLARGFFNTSFKFGTTYDINQPKSSQILKSLNKLSNVLFTAYFRKNKEYVLDAIIQFHSERECLSHQKTLISYAIPSELKQDNDVFYLIVRGINSTHIGDLIAEKYDEFINQKAIAFNR